MLIALCLLLSIVTIGVLYVFFAPFYIEINSTKSLYRLRLHYLASISFLVNNDPEKMELKILAWKKELNISSSIKDLESEKRIKQRTKLPKIFLKKILAVLKTFKINNLKVNLDFGDMQLNGILYPVFYCLGLKINKQLYINFEGKNFISVEIENSLARISWAYITS